MHKTLHMNCYPLDISRLAKGLMGQNKPQVCHKQKMKSMCVSKQKRSPIAKDIPAPIPSHSISCFVDPRMESFQTGSQSYATRGLHFPKARWGTRGSGIQQEPCGASIRWLKHSPRAVSSQHLNPVRLQQRLQIESMLAAWGLHSAGLTRLPLTWYCKYGNHHPALRVTPGAPLKWYTANHEKHPLVFLAALLGAQQAHWLQNSSKIESIKKKKRVAPVNPHCAYYVTEDWRSGSLEALQADRLNLLAALLNQSFPAQLLEKSSVFISDCEWGLQISPECNSLDCFPLQLVSLLASLLGFIAPPHCFPDPSPL